MPTSVWNGALSLGLVVVPVRLYPAIQKKTVRFRELDRGGRRVRHVRVSEPEVEYEPMDRGRAFGPIDHPAALGCQRRHFLASHAHVLSGCDLESLANLLKGKLDRRWLEIT